MNVCCSVICKQSWQDQCSDVLSARSEHDVQEGMEDAWWVKFPVKPKKHSMYPNTTIATGLNPSGRAQMR
jgi:hypothetical protein